MKNGLSVFSSELAEIQEASRQQSPEKYGWTFEDVVLPEGGEGEWQSRDKRKDWSCKNIRSETPEWQVSL